MANETNKKERIAESLERTRQMSSLVGAMAHQWKQPLNILGLLIQDIKDAYTFGELDDEYLNNFVTKGMENVRFISHSIDDFRSFFDPHPNPEHTDLKAVCEGIAAMLSHQYTSHKINLLVEGERFDVPLYVNTFRQAIMNILDVIKEHYDANEVRGHHIMLRLNSEEKRLEIIESSKGFDLAEAAKALEGTGEAKPAYTPLKSVALYLSDSAGAVCTTKATETGNAFIITFS